MQEDDLTPVLTWDAEEERYDSANQTLENIVNPEKNESHLSFAPHSYRASEI